MNMTKCFYCICFFLTIVTSCSSDIEFSLNVAGDNREELETVLEYFKNDQNPLKYKAAKFLVENLPYHSSYCNKDIELFDSAYITMATSAIELRDSIINNELKSLGTTQLSKVPEVKTIRADYLIKAINDACDIWEQVNWHNDYDESLFFNYVLPYRVFDEVPSDWHETIKKEFPYLNAPVIYSMNGVQFPAFQEKLVAAKAIESTSAIKGKAVQFSKKGASVIYNIHSDIAVQKLMRFRYSAIEKDVKISVEINGKRVGSYDLEPTYNIFSFKRSRFGMVIDLNKGDNSIIIRYENKPFYLDYIELAAYEPYYDEKCVDYSASYCQIQNMGTKNFVSIDTLKSNIWKPIELHKHSTNDWSLNIRLDYLGYSIWRISPKYVVDLCLEDRWVSLDTLQAVSVSQPVDPNNGDYHQKWVIIPIEDGMCKIMNKLTGLFWESTIDKDTGKEILIQNFYSGKATQKWKITKNGINPYAKDFYKIGSVISEGLRVTDAMKQFEFIANRGGITPTLSSICKYRTGKCQDEASYTIALSRYLGIPTALDFVPHWGNRPNDHVWSVVILPNGKSTPFYMGFAPGDTAQYAHSYLKPKIFRRKFELNREIVDDLNGEKSVPKLFQIPTFIDVTDEYYKTTDVKRAIPEEYQDRQVAYICVSDREHWIPVHYGKVSRGTATFKSMGRNILYTVGIWEDNHIVPIGNPFIIKANGEIREIVYDKNKKQTLNLYRKYPFFAKFDAFNNRMGLGRFQGSNNSDFTKEYTFFTHEGATEGCWLEKELKPSKQKYKYLRYIGWNGSFCNVNEIEFYNSMGEKLMGKVIGTQGTDKHTKETVFDGDVLTGFNGISPDGHWVGLELSKPSDVKKIRYMPRNDGNCVAVGDKYQLLMYDNGKWKTLAWRYATDNKLVFRDMPTGGLYLLKDRTRGKEERIFTYENGKQVWW